MLNELELRLDWRIPRANAICFVPGWNEAREKSKLSKLGNIFAGTIARAHKLARSHTFTSAFKSALQPKSHGYLHVQERKSVTFDNSMQGNNTLNKRSNDTRYVHVVDDSNANNSYLNIWQFRR
ncbi:uncharacterized protein FFB20_04824 [Fusarium fujikuroi]|nr:uncharacterized protein FFB20_04824 [Fusarium fujikuroi]SCN76699.1 uncharacterized protein FFE2_03609 [Fusarium fujikuroi]SCN78773.1 uncharacterized protein FFM5_01942 [Fusarium fujikuroi]SCN94988.1 uncharacterized protein FFC1_07189 [Fusarium fujikuroi]SCO33570.1 uncharacterized protein FFMR_03148 [Fusarium fujikuroi]